ncbi:response regulator [Microvirga sp. VF16]|nr:response regulator [Microvirga sp. VF16]
MPEFKASSPQTVVLVVEPDPYVRAMAADVLDQEGFEVIEASSADYASTILQSRNDVSVLFTEAATPGVLNGFDLTRIAHTQNPQIVVIMVVGALPSGFSGAAPEARFVCKPYRMADVIPLIRELTRDQSHSG